MPLTALTLLPTPARKVGWRGTRVEFAYQPSEPEDDDCPDQHSLASSLTPNDVEIGVATITGSVDPSTSQQQQPRENNTRER